MSEAVSLDIVDAAGPALADAALRFDAGLLDVAQATAVALLDRARTLAENGLLRDVTGAYVASFHADVAHDGRGVRVTLGSDAPQAGILEFGGTTAPHDIRPRQAQALAFAAGGGVGSVFAAVVHDPGARIGPHPVLRTALGDVEGEALQGCREIVARLGEGFA